jgi:uncharacterized membrane protein YqhA
VGSRDSRWVGFILNFRYLATVVVLVLLVHAAGLLALGVFRAYEAYELAMSGREWVGSDRPGIHIAESVDALLFSLVLIVLSCGTATLFLRPGGQEVDPRVPKWMRVESITELKALLWESILVVLVVGALTSLTAHMDNLHWNLLVLPVAILLLSVSLFLARRASS